AGSAPSPALRAMSAGRGVPRPYTVLADTRARGLAGEPAARQGRRVNPPENPDAVGAGYSRPGPTTRCQQGEACLAPTYSIDSMPGPGRQRNANRARRASTRHVLVDARE